MYLAIFAFIFIIIANYFTMWFPLHRVTSKQPHPVLYDKIKEWISQLNGATKDLK